MYSIIALTVLSYLKRYPTLNKIQLLLRNASRVS